MNNTALIQKNCKGIRTNYKELLLLLNKYNPKVVCLQEQPQYYVGVPEKQQKEKGSRKINQWQ